MSKGWAGNKEPQNSVVGYYPPGQILKSAEKKVSKKHMELSSIYNLSMAVSDFGQFCHMVYRLTGNDKNSGQICFFEDLTAQKIHLLGKNGNGLGWSSNTKSQNG